MFYRDLGVPDTVNGRFDLLLLHLWLLLRRLRRSESGPALSQALFDRFCEDMDDNLREMGVGDLKVPKQMRALGEAFYGRTRAYDEAMEQGAEALAEAICRNILEGGQLAPARRLAAYAGAVEAELACADEAAVLAACFVFPSPIREDAAP